MAVPVGTGILYAGMNDAKVHDNIFDNWRDVAMLFAVPDALTNGGGAEGSVFPGVSCVGAPASGLSTSCGNRFFDNRMGRFEFPAAIDQFGAQQGQASAASLPNGNDFWWDEFATNTGNCWFSNTGRDGTAASVSGPGAAGRTPGIPPNLLPDCGGGQSPASSIGAGDLAKEVYLIDCSEGPDEDTGPPPWAVILHSGRRSGRAYRTPVLAFRRDRTVIVALLYGEESDWLRNLRAGGGRLVRMGRTYELSTPRVVETGAATELSLLSPPARAYCRLADNQALLEVGERVPGFGRGEPAPQR